MNTTRIAAAGLALAMTALILPAAAFAQQEAPITVEGAIEQSPVVYVSYADLDLSSPSALALLRGRVRGAAQRLCVDGGVQPLKLVMDGRACFAEAIAGAEQQIGAAVAALDRGERYAASGRIAIAARLRQ